MPPQLRPALLLAGLALAGCGGDDDPAPPAATTLADLPADACPLVSDPEATTGIAFDDGVPAGDERRRVCTWQAGGPDERIGLTLAVEGGDRFDEKAERSTEALGEGEDVGDLGGRARFWFSDEDLPEGVGGLLVEAGGERTLEVTLQGLDEGPMREAAVSLAREALGRL